MNRPLSPIETALEAFLRKHFQADPKNSEPHPAGYINQHGLVRHMPRLKGCRLDYRGATIRGTGNQPDASEEALVTLIQRGEVVRSFSHYNYTSFFVHIELGG